MSAAETWLTSGATFIGGSGATAFFNWLRARRRMPSENLRNEVAAAADVNAIALATLARVSEELQVVTRRLDVVEAAQEESIAELNRVTGLFREAIAVLRTVIDAARQGQISEPQMSAELMAEVERGGGSS